MLGCALWLLTVFLLIHMACSTHFIQGPFQYIKKRLVGWSRKVSNPRDLLLRCSEIWQAAALLCETSKNLMITRLRWLHNERDGVSNHRRPHCLLKCWFKRWSKETSKLRATGPCVWGIHRWPVNSPHKGPVTRKVFPFDDVIMLHVYMTLPLVGLVYFSGTVVSHI